MTVVVYSRLNVINNNYETEFFTTWQLYDQMKYRILTYIFCSLMLGGCQDSERIISQSEIDLKLKFVAPVSVLSSESYGWSEEGGDRALVKLGVVDCMKVAQVLDVKTVTPDRTSDYFRMFGKSNISLTKVRIKFWMNEHGDTKQYVLDEQSCTLYRDAFFE